MGAPDELSLAHRHAEASQALRALLHRAGAVVAFISLDETEHADWSAELRGAAMDVAFDILTRGGGDAPGPDATKRSTEVVARDGGGAPLAAMRLEGWHGEAILPALAAWTRASGRSAVWRRRGEARVTFDGRFTLQHPPVTRDEASICADLAAEGWTCRPDATGITLTRARRGRDLPVTVLLVVISALVLPLAAVLAMALVGRRLVRGRWDFDPEAMQPWRRVEDRIDARVESASLSLRRAHDDRERYAHRWTPETLSLMYASPGGQEPELALVEADRVRVLPLLLRGEVRHSMFVMRSPALLAELVARRWSAAG